MTHPLPTGTCNISINVTKIERNELGQAAYKANVSINRLIKGFINEGLHHPTSTVVNEATGSRAITMLNTHNRQSSESRRNP